MICYLYSIKSTPTSRLQAKTLRPWKMSRLRQEEPGAGLGVSTVYHTRAAPSKVNGIPSPRAPEQEKTVGKRLLRGQ